MWLKIDGEVIDNEAGIVVCEFDIMNEEILMLLYTSSNNDVA